MLHVQHNKEYLIVIANLLNFLMQTSKLGFLVLGMANNCGYLWLYKDVKVQMEIIEKLFGAH